VINVIAIDAERVVERTAVSTDDIAALTKGYPVVWVDVVGLGDADLVRHLGEIFDLHPLALEDVLNTHHRPKTEEYDSNAFVIARMASIKDDRLAMEQVSLFFGERFVVSFQEHAGDCLDPVRSRIRKPNRRNRFINADYLAYALIDAIVDGYFPVLEHFDGRLNRLEDTIIEHPGRDLVPAIHELKREFQFLRHSIWPLREPLRRLADNSAQVREDTRPFLRDCQDHVIQIVDILETFAERASALTELYLSSLSFKMNEVMKVLTIIATMFIPLSFVAGIYGMNFDRDSSPLNMPELGWYFGYPLALTLMGAMAVGMMIYFVRRGWIRFGRLGAPSSTSQQ
jgi:magnesium transporter